MMGGAVSVLTGCRLAKRGRPPVAIYAFVYIDLDGEIMLDAEVESWGAYGVARVIATRGKSFHEGITDHLISNYIKGLEGRVSPRQPGVMKKC